MREIDNAAWWRKRMTWAQRRKAIEHLRAMAECWRLEGQEDYAAQLEHAAKEAEAEVRS